MWSDVVPIDEWANELLVLARLRQLKVGAEGKPSLKRARVGISRPEAT